MRDSFVGSIVTKLRNITPVPIAERGGLPRIFRSSMGNTPLSQLRAYSANGTLFSIVNLTSSAVSRVEWKLWRKAKSGKDEDRVQVTKHLALDVLARPNPFNTRQFLFESTQQHIDLVGEGWWVVERNIFGWPVHLWLVRPDTIAPMPSPTEGLVGYIHTGPEGEKTYLDAKDVLWMKMPNPVDTGPCGRGAGPTQSVLMNVDSVRYSTEWNRNFFINSAEPGGIIQLPKDAHLDDNEFNRLRMQWAEEHRGVSAAHHVGILENGAEWKSNASTQKDMQFVELNQLSREVIREAFRASKFMLGEVDDVNRATADASDAAFASWLVTPRLDRIKETLNVFFLPQFGPFGHGTGQPDVEFDYDSPVPTDPEQENAALTAKTAAFKVLMDAGADATWAASVVGLPTPTMRAVAAPVGPSNAPPTDPVPAGA